MTPLNAFYARAALAACVTGIAWLAGPRPAKPPLLQPVSPKARFEAVLRLEQAARRPEKLSAKDVKAAHTTWGRDGEKLLSTLRASARAR